MTFSVNNRVIVEVYHQTGITTEVKNGFAKPGQRDGTKGLKVLVSTTLSTGQHIPAGSIAWFREETLYNMPWTKQIFSSPFLNQKYMIADVHNVDIFELPNTENNIA